MKMSCRKNSWHLNYVTSTYLHRYIDLFIFDINIYIYIYIYIYIFIYAYTYVEMSKRRIINKITKNAQ